MIPFTLLFYIGRVFLFHLFVVSATLFCLTFLSTLVETARRLITREINSMTTISKMAFFQTPALLELAFPFIFFVSAMSCFFSLAKRHELDAARTSGISAWVLISPALIIAFLSGLLIFSVYNPIGSEFSSQYQELRAKLIKRQQNVFTLSQTGMWLREGDDLKNSIIHAQQVGQEGIRLFNMTIFLYENQDVFTGRIDAEKALLKNGAWELENVWITPQNRHSYFVKNHEQATTLTPDHIYDSVAPPQSIGFWSLGKFITLAQNAGFSVASYQLQWHSLISLPFFLVAMVFVGAATIFFFSARQGRESFLMISGLLFAFFIYMLIFLSRKLVTNFDTSIIALVWAPIILSLSTGLFLFLQKEEG